MTPESSEQSTYRRDGRLLIRDAPSERPRDEDRTPPPPPPSTTPEQGTERLRAALEVIRARPWIEREAWEIANNALEAALGATRPVDRRLPRAEDAPHVHLPAAGARPAARTEGDDLLGGDLIPRAIEMAREIRRGESRFGPYALYDASLGRADVYRHAMLEAGYVVPSDTNIAPQVCDVCGYDFGEDSPRRAVTDGWASPLKREDLTPDEIAAVEFCLGRELR